MTNDEKLARAIMDRIERDGSVHLSSLVDEIRRHGPRSKPAPAPLSLEELTRVYTHQNQRQPQEERQRIADEMDGKLTVTEGGTGQPEPLGVYLYGKPATQQQEERHQRRAEALQRRQWERQF